MVADKATYPPINTLKSVCPDVWIVDGPVIRFGMPWPKMPFPTRMTVIRLGSALFVHSPTPLTSALRREVDAIGRPAWLIGPNRIHYWWLPEWRQAFPQAETWLAPRIPEQAKGRIDFDHRTLATGPYPWEGAIDTLPIAGRFMTEMVFFHRPSRTLVLTDLVENFEPDKLDNFFMRWLVRAGGVMAPDGQTPRDMRLTFDKRVIREAADRMLAWSPERVILAHGRWFETDGAARLRQALRWAL